MGARIKKYDFGLSLNSKGQTPPEQNCVYRGKSLSRGIFNSVDKKLVCSIKSLVRGMTVQMFISLRIDVPKKIGSEIRHM